MSELKVHKSIVRASARRAINLSRDLRHSKNVNSVISDLDVQKYLRLF